MNIKKQKAILFLLALTTLILVRTQDNCLVSDPNNLSKCLVCKSGYFNKNFFQQVGDSINFDISDCMNLERSNPEEKSIYIADSSYQKQADSNGSLISPFSNIFDAFMAGQEYSQSRSASNITFYLIKAQGEIESDESNMSREYFWSSSGTNDIYHFFRRVNVNITMKPLLCASSNFENGCFKNEEKRPIIYLRTERQFIFVTNILSIENLVIDGSDLLFENLSDTNKQLYLNKRYCDDLSLQKSYDPGNNFEEKASICFIMNKSSNPIGKSFALINMEPIFDCLDCMQQPTKVSLENCEFKYIHSFSESRSSLSALVSAQKLKFSLFIMNTLFHKMNLPNGIFTSNWEWTTSLYSGVESLYMKAIGNQSSNNDNNTILLMNSEVSSLNNLRIKYPNELRGIFSIESLSHELNIMSCIFRANYLESSVKSIFYISIPSYEIDIFSKIYLATNLVEYNKIESLFNFQRGNENYYGKRYAAFFEANKFSNNIGCVLIGSYIDIEFSNSVVTNTSIETNAFFLWNIGRIFIKNSSFNEINKYTTQSPFELIVFLGYLPESYDAIFYTDPGSSNNLTRESLIIDHSNFFNFFTGLCRNNVFNYLQIFKSVFKNISILNNSMIAGSVEDEFYLIDCYFENIKLILIFDLPFTRNLTLKNIYSNNITCDGFIVTYNYGGSSPYPVINFWQFVMKNSQINSISLHIEGYFGISMTIVYFSECLFENITNNFEGFFIYLRTIIYLDMYECTFHSIQGENFQILYLGGPNNYGYRNYGVQIGISSTLFIQKEENYLLKILDTIDIEICMLVNSTFIGTAEITGEASAIFRMTYSNYSGFLEISNCIFKGLRGRNVGALHIKLWGTSDLLIDSCLFIENFSKDFSADLMIINSQKSTLITEIIEQRKKKIDIGFGIRNNIFFSSRGSQGGSIFIRENSQAIIYNNTFINASADYGGVLLAKKGTEIIFINNRVLFCSTTTEGGALWGHNNRLLVFYSLFENNSAKSGGAIFLYSAEAVLYRNLFSRGHANFGGDLYFQRSIIQINFMELVQSTSKTNGGTLYFSRGTTKLENIKISNCNTEGRGVLYLEYPEYFSLNYLTIFSSSARLEGTIYIYGQPTERVSLQNVACIQTFSLGNGNCLLLSDSFAILRNLTLNVFNTKGSSIYIVGVQIISSLLMENLYSNSSLISKSLIDSLNSKIIMKNTTIKNIKFSSNLAVFYFEQSNVFLNLLDFTVANENYYQVAFLTAESSDINLQNLKLKLSRKISGLYFSNCMVVSINDLHIFQPTPSWSYKGIALDVLKSNLNVIKSSITGAYSNEGPILYLENANLTLSELNLIENNVPENKAIIYCINTEENSVQFIKLNKLFGVLNRGNEMQIIEYDKVHLSQVFFSQLLTNSPYTTTQTIIFLNINSINLNNLRIEGYKGHSPVSVNSSANKRSDIAIDNLIVSKCFSFESGGAFNFYGRITGNITNSTFYKLKTNKSGGVFAFTCPYNDCALNIEDNVFSMITAEKYGAILKQDDPGITFGKKNEIKSNIKAGLGIFTVGDPTRIIILKNYTTEIDQALLILKAFGLNDTDILSEVGDVVSGQPIELVALLLDEFNNTMIYENEGKLTISADDSNMTFIENEYAFFNNGFAIFNELKVKSTPGNPTNIKLVYSNDYSGKSFYNTVKFSMRKCVRGEIVSGITCQTCPKGYFSLEDDPSEQQTKICLLCPQKADCVNGHVIFPIKGYWRKDENQTNLVQCPSEEACPGGGLMSGFVYTPVCSAGYKGYLCSSCESQYGYNAERQCIKCSENFSQHIKFALLTLFSFIMIVYQTQIAFQISENSSKSRALMKILVDHMSYVSFIYSFRIEWTSTVLSMLMIGDNYVSLVPKEMFNFDCILTTMGAVESKFIINFICISVTPVVYGGFCYLLLIFYLKVKKLSEHLQSSKRLSIIENEATAKTHERMSLEMIENIPNEVLKQNLTEIDNDPPLSFLPKKKPEFSILSQITAMSLIIFYNLYHRIMLNAIQLLSCIRIDDSNQTYLEVNIKIECWHSEHVNILIFLSLSNLLIWGITTPVLLFLLIRALIHKYKNTQNESLKKLIDFITLDYKDKYYFWDLVCYFTKFIILILSVIIRPLEPASQGTLIILAFILLFLLQEALKPYKYRFINNLKTLSYLTSIGSIALAIMASNKKINDSKRFACVLISGFSTFIFYFVWIFNFLNLKKEAMKEKKKLAKKKRSIT